MDWNSVGVQNENQWLLFWGFINYRSNYQVTIFILGVAWYDLITCGICRWGRHDQGARFDPVLTLWLSCQQRFAEKILGVGRELLAFPHPPPPIWILSVCRNHRAPKLRLDLLLLNVKIIKFYYFFLIMGFKEWGHRYRQSQRDSIISRALHGRWSYTKAILW